MRSHRMVREDPSTDQPNALDGVWQCQECPRRMMLRAEPFEKMVLVHGDEHVPHGGSVAPPGLGIRIGTTQQEDQR